MTIGIITYHRAVNPGAFLQAYALQKVIQNAGYNVEVIEHTTARTLKKEFISCFYRNKGLKRIWETGTIFKYLWFQNQCLALSSYEAGEFLNKLNKYDAVILGSDEIWNYQNWFFGLTPIFFGHGIDKPKKISYAPSFGSIGIDEILPEIIEQSIPKIEHLSVRDYHSQSIIQKNFNITPSVCLDPTLLYDFLEETKDYEEREDIFLVYATEISLENQQQIKDFCNKRNLRIISLLFFYNWADKCYISLHPFKVIEWFKRAKYVFTNTFHGTLFSIRFAENFLLKVGVGKKEKLSTIIDMFSLENHTTNQNIEIIPTQISNSGRIEMIRENRQKSLDFLFNSLS